VLALIHIVTKTCLFCSAIECLLFYLKPAKPPYFMLHTRQNMTTNTFSFSLTIQCFVIRQVHGTKALFIE